MAAVRGNAKPPCVNMLTPLVGRQEWRRPQCSGGSDAFHVNQGEGTLFALADTFLLFSSLPEMRAPWMERVMWEIPYRRTERLL